MSTGMAALIPAAAVSAPCIAMLDQLSAKLDFAFRVILWLVVSWGLLHHSATSPPVRLFLAASPERRLDRLRCRVTENLTNVSTSQRGAAAGTGFACGAPTFLCLNGADRPMNQ